MINLTDDAMNHAFRILMLLLCCCVGALRGLAQTGRFYSTADGLSSSLVNQLLQDRQGFLWSATEYGLNRFDGLHFTNYWNVSGDSLSIKNNYVRSLFEDSRGSLFVGCIDGLMRYDRESDDFHEVPMLRGGRQVYPHVTQMRELRNGEIWMTTTGQGLFRLNAARTEALSADDLLREANYNFQSNLYEDAHGILWIGTEGNGLIRCDLRTNEARRCPSFPCHNVSAIVEDVRGDLFVGTQTCGLFRLERGTERFVPVGSDNGQALTVCCMAVVNNRLLVGTDGQGLKRHNPQTGRLETCYISGAPPDLAEGKVHTLFHDREGNLWLGLFQKGIALIPRQETPFEYAGYRSPHNNPIGKGCVMSICQTDDYHLWVGTDNEGLFELGADGKRLRHHAPGSGPHTVAGTVMCIHEDSDHTLWIGTYTRGIGRLDRRTGRCDYLPDIGNEKVLSIAEDKRKNLYIATLGSGFYRYHLPTGQLTHYESSKQETGDLKRDELANDWINHLYCDSEGLLWLAHYQGISCFDPQRGSFLALDGQNTLVTGCVGYVLTEGEEGVIYAGTTNGLYRFDKRKGAASHYTTRDGLSNNVVCGLCGDGQGNIWLSTYQGISKFDAAEERFTNYHAGDGLQSNTEFMHGAFCTARSGRIYFGGINGITSFLPGAIDDAPRRRTVWLTDFFVFDRPVHKNTLSGGKPVTDCAVTDATRFRLAADDNTFRIVFSTLQYVAPEEIAYQYKIEELDSRWLSTEPGANQAVYNNLPPGKYTFSVRSVDHGQPSSPPRTVEILIAPPWYATWWAYLIYMVGILLLVASGANNIRLHIGHRREAVEQEHLKQLNEAKLQFFINISHEIRTPLTLIVSPLEKLLAANPGGELQKTYLMIHRNAQRILRLINQLMDIRKLDKGQMHMHFRETDMVGFVADVVHTFDYTARQRGIRFGFSHEMERLDVWVDLNNFDKVLMNILSNAFKYTPAGGEIRVSLVTGTDAGREDALRDYFEIAVADTGIGIEEEKIARIFERFYQVDNDITRTIPGTGIGLHLSKSLVGLHHGTLTAENRTDVKGSIFRIRLPLGCAHLQAEEMDATATDSGQAFLQGPAAEVRPALPQAPVGSDPETDANEPGKDGRTQTGCHILVVEDEAEVRDYLTHELADTYRVETCRNGREAFERVLASPPDVVISDIMMPEMDGLELCRKLKQSTQANHVPVILLTAKTQQADKLEGMETGADAYLGKPFDMQMLRGTIANLIRNRRLLRNKFSGAQQQVERQEKVNVKSMDDKLMDRIMKVVNDNLANPDLNVEMLAAEVGLSRVHINRKLKELTNLSPREFIKNIRLQQAAKLLAEDKKLSISEIAYATGYSNLSHFSNNFRDKYGVTPTEHRERS